MKTGRRSGGSFLRLLAITLLMAPCSACGRPRREPPRTYPVTGEISDTGGRSVAGTMIQFAPQNLEFRSQGIVDASGKFKLQLLFDNEQLEGAVEGQHQATIYFPPDKIPADGLMSLRVETPFVVRPGANHFQISLPAQRK